jgi:hypothetical protein
MATPRERFVEALTFLRQLQKKGVVGIHTDDLPNTKQRQLLIKNGFIRKVAKGWYIASNPMEKAGETMQALESASVDQDITPFATFIGYLVSEGMNGHAVAQLPHTQ